MQKAKVHVNLCPSSPGIREMEINTMKYYLTLIRLLKIRQVDNTWGREDGSGYKDYTAGW